MCITTCPNEFISGVGLYPYFSAGIESAAATMFFSKRVNSTFTVVVTGLATGPGVASCPRQTPQPTSSPTITTPNFLIVVPSLSLVVHQPKCSAGRSPRSPAAVLCSTFPEAATAYPRLPTRHKQISPGDVAATIRLYVANAHVDVNRSSFSRRAPSRVSLLRNSIRSIQISFTFPGAFALIIEALFLEQRLSF